MQVSYSDLPGVLLLKPTRFGDARGFFSESWNRKKLAEHGVALDFVQDNHSVSTAVDTVRGLHFQAPPHAQDKLVRCGQGALFDVAVDIRKSPGAEDEEDEDNGCCCRVLSPPPLPFVTSLTCQVHTSVPAGLSNGSAQSARPIRRSGSPTSTNKVAAARTAWKTAAALSRSALSSPLSLSCAAATACCACCTA